MFATHVANGNCSTIALISSKSFFEIFWQIHFHFPIILEHHYATHPKQRFTNSKHF